MLFLLPFLQALAAVFTIWGVCNTPAVNDVAVTYGVGTEDGVTFMELFKSYGATAIGGISSLVMWLYRRKQSTELLLAIGNYLAHRGDMVAFRRLMLAVGDFLANDAATMQGVTLEQANFFKASADGIRQTAAGLQTDKPATTTTK